MSTQTPTIETSLPARLAAIEDPKARETITVLAAALIADGYEFHEDLTSNAAPTIYLTRRFPDKTRTQVGLSQSNLGILRKEDVTDKQLFQVWPFAPAMTPAELFALLEQQERAFPTPAVRAAAKKSEERTVALLNCNADAFIGWMAAAARTSPAIAKEVDRFIANR